MQELAAPGAQIEQLAAAISSQILAAEVLGELRRIAGVRFVLLAVANVQVVVRAVRAGRARSLCTGDDEATHESLFSPVLATMRSAARLISSPMRNASISGVVGCEPSA